MKSLGTALFAIACLLAPAQSEAQETESASPVSPTSIVDCEPADRFYCLLDLGVDPGFYAIQMSQADAEGVPTDCAPSEKPQVPEHLLACDWYANGFRFRPNASLPEPYQVVFSFAALASLKTSSRPAQPAELIVEGYEPFFVGEEDSTGCTDLACRWTYPPRALRREEFGTVTMFVEVSEQGRSEACWIVFGPSETLNSDACRRLTAPYVRFTPARNSNGDPVASVLTITMGYTIN